MNFDYTDQMPAVQWFFPYCLFRLSRLPTPEEHAVRDLPSVLLSPSLVEKIDSPSPWPRSEWYLSSRVLRPLEGFGLLVLRKTKDEDDFLEEETHIRKTALFDRFVARSPHWPRKPVEN